MSALKLGPDLKPYRRRTLPSRGTVINFIGLGLLATCYVAALWGVFTTKREEGNAEVIRLSHWQLELGVREGLDEVIRDFEEKKAREGQPVKIVQLPIPERAYTQYVTTQLIGETAPDIIAIGRFPEEYLGRYFLPLSKQIQQKNPLLEERFQELVTKENRTEEEDYYLEYYRDLKDKPWMSSFVDGSRSTYRESSQEFYGIGLSTFTVRVFYNKDLFREALGSDEPPQTYRELLDQAARIKQYAAETGQDIDPIASSSYQINMLLNSFVGASTTQLYLENDLNWDGQTEGMEKLMGILRGKWGPENEAYRAGIQMVQNLAAYFPKGFMSLGRMDSGFAFIQGRAGMITSGSWDAKSLIQKIQDQPEGKRFEVGIFDLPMVTPDDPEFGDYAGRRRSEASVGINFTVGITRFSKHQDLCLEFLQFCSLPEENAKLNRAADWIPLVRGAKATELLEHFRPNYVGYWGRMDFNFRSPGAAQLRESQLYWPYISGNINYDTYAGKLLEDLPESAATDYEREWAAMEEAIPNSNATRSAYLAGTVFGTPESRAENEARLLRSWEPLLKYLTGQRRLRYWLEESGELQTEKESSSPFYEQFTESLSRKRLSKSQ